MDDPVAAAKAIVDANYLSAVAHQLAGDDIEPGITAFSERLIGHGGAAWTADRVGGSARLRLYRATAREHFGLDEHDERIPFALD